MPSITRVLEGRCAPLASWGGDVGAAPSLRGVLGRSRRSQAVWASSSPGDAPSPRRGEVSGTLSRLLEAVKDPERTGVAGAPKVRPLRALGPRHGLLVAFLAPLSESAQDQGSTHG